MKPRPSASCRALVWRERVPFARAVALRRERLESLSLAGLRRRVGEQSLDGLRRLGAALLLELVDPLRDGRDHVARGLLRGRAFGCDFGRRLLLAVPLFALDDFDRG